MKTSKKGTYEDFQLNNTAGKNFYFRSLKKNKYLLKWAIASRAS
jgi:hypothetical protein